MPRQLTFLGKPILRAKAAVLDRPDAPEWTKLAEAMVETMLANNGVGLAAPQIGEGKRLIVFRVPEERVDTEFGEQPLPIYIVVNPEITPLEPDMELGIEGCLSLPGLRGMVPRYRRIGYRGYDLNGAPVEREASGFHARVVQHEVDHLDGVMYLDRMHDFTSLVHESELIRRQQREAEIAAKLAAEES